MKNRTAIIRLFICACLLSSTAAFAQVTQFWTGGTNGANTGIDVGQATNWGGTLPNTANSDTGEWSGTVPGPLNLAYDTASLASGFGQSGVNFHIDSGQTSPVTIGTICHDTTWQYWTHDRHPEYHDFDSGVAFHFSVGPTVGIRSIGWADRRGLIIQWSTIQRM